MAKRIARPPTQISAAELDDETPEWLPRIPNRLAALRRDRGLSYDRLGQLLVPPVDGKTIERLEKGPRRGGMQMTVEWMYRLARALECHPTDLMPELPATTLTPHERSRLGRYRGLAEADRMVIDRMLDALPISGTVPATPTADATPRRRGRRRSNAA